MKRFLFATLLCAIGHCAYGADTDGDGLLDLIDVPGFNPNSSGDVIFERRSIQDLDGANLLTNATTLDLYGNLVTSIEQGDFQGLGNLQLLHLGFNQITSIENGDFQGLTNLQELSLTGNQITRIENGDFEGLGNLQRLALAYNQITSIENGDFQGLSNLRTLNLYSNQFTSLESGVFQGLSNLRQLSLDRNQITSLENGDFQGLTNLQELSLTRNQITRIESGDLQGLSNLQDLFLHGNQITSIESGAFQGLSNLQKLYLGDCLPFGPCYGNQITSLENGAFRGLNNLQTLFLLENNIQELNFTGATFDSLGGCAAEMGVGFCADTAEITDLILDDAVLSLRSFQAIIAATQSISTASLVGLSFSDTSPDDLSNLLTLETLDNVRVDQALFDRYAAEFNAFDAIPGNTVTVAVPGDYNQNGIVDAADYTVWRDSLGQTGVFLAADGNGNDEIDAGDYDFWKTHFGQTTGSDSGATATATIPEPTTLLLMFAAVGWCVRPRRAS